MNMRFSSQHETGRLAVTSLYRLVVLRCLAIALQIITLLVAVFYLHQSLPIIPIAVVIILYAGLTFYTWSYCKNREFIDSNEYFLHLLADVTVLSALLYFSGGATNPFTMVYLLPLTVAIVMLPAFHIWGLATITAVYYTLLLWKHVPMEMAHSHGSHDEFDVHIVGMWFSFVITAILISYFVVSMRTAMQQQQRALAEARERVMRDEQLITLGTLAASTAHELGTPLGTMALLLDELDDAETAEEQKTENIAVMRSQVSRCREALTNLSASAGSVRLSGGSAITLDDYILGLCQECETNRPAKRVKLQWGDDAIFPEIVVDRSLSQAIVNIIDNAQKVSTCEVTVLAMSDTNMLSIEVLDNGPGVSESMRQSLGKEPVAIDSQTKDGLGIGLFLAYSIIRRFGGQVALNNRQEGGSRTKVELPLQTLKAN